MEKTLYSIYDPETLLITQAIFATEPPENSTTLLVTELWAKPKLNDELTEIINVATPEQQAAFEAEFNTEQQ